jgi:hypothetical protein
VIVGKLLEKNGLHNNVKNSRKPEIHDETRPNEIPKRIYVTVPVTDTETMDI